MTVERWTDETLDRFAATVATAIVASNEAISANTSVIAASNERLTRIEQIQESNARAIAANSEAIAANAERIGRFDEQMEDLTAVTQAIGRDLAQLVSTQQAAEQERAELRQATLGIANLLASLDSDRPTILRKLNAIENKVDRILEKEDRQAG